MRLKDFSIGYARTAVSVAEGFLGCCGLMRRASKPTPDTHAPMLGHAHAFVRFCSSFFSVVQSDRRHNYLSAQGLSCLLPISASCFAAALVLATDEVDKFTPPPSSKKGREVT